MRRDLSGRAMRAAICSLAVFALSHCGASSNRQGDGAVFGDGNYNLPEGSPTPSGCPQGNEAIQREILVPMCASAACHGGSMPGGGLDLLSPGVETRLANRMSATCAGEILIVPGDVNRSFFFHKVADARPRCGDRMPPPPSNPLDAVRLSCLQAWIAQGLAPTDPDAGVTMLPDAGSRFAPDVGTTPECDPNDGPRLRGAMCPGSECISCHSPGGSAANEGLGIAGTVFPRWDSDVTAGVAGIRVTLRNRMTDAILGSTVTNSVGNFWFRRAYSFPLTAEIDTGSRVLRMPVDVDRPGCNDCHTLPTTELGPGRIAVDPP